MSKFGKIIEKHLNIQMGTLEKPDCNKTKPREDTVRRLMDVHFKKYILYSEENNISVLKTEVQDSNPEWLTTGKLSLAIHQFKYKKVPSPDVLRPLVLKNTN